MEGGRRLETTLGRRVARILFLMAGMLAESVVEGQDIPARRHRRWLIAWRRDGAGCPKQHANEEEPPLAEGKGKAASLTIEYARRVQKCVAKGKFFVRGKRGS